MIYRLIIFVFVYLFAANFAFAGDASELKIIGFSKDGRFLAFEVSGVQDGSGIPYCEVYFIDVENNDFAVPPLKLQGKESDEQTLANLQAQAAMAIKKKLQDLQIDENIQGQMLVYHPLSDLTNDGCYVSFSIYPGVYPPPSGYKYKLFLEERFTGKKCFGLDTKIFTLKLKHDSQTKILQEDSHLPASRGCVYKYRIERVMVYENKIAVFLNIFLPGFEGPDVRHMVVTGSFGFGE